MTVPTATAIAANIAFEEDLEVKQRGAAWFLVLVVNCVLYPVGLCIWKWAFVAPRAYAVAVDGRVVELLQTISRLDERLRAPRPIETVRGELLAVVSHAREELRPLKQRHDWNGLEAWHERFRLLVQHAFLDATVTTFDQNAAFGYGRDKSHRDFGATYSRIATHLDQFLIPRLVSRSIDPAFRGDDPRWSCWWRPHQQDADSD